MEHNQAEKFGGTQAKGRISAAQSGWWNVDSEVSADDRGICMSTGPNYPVASNKEVVAVVRPKKALIPSRATCNLHARTSPDFGVTRRIPAGSKGTLIVAKPQKPSSDPKSGERRRWKILAWKRI